MESYGASLIAPNVGINDPAEIESLLPWSSTLLHLLCVILVVQGIKFFAAQSVLWDQVCVAACIL